ncbi:MAG: methionyl-tRNA formyltransferase [Gemmatimonadaceae bacterium]
MRIVFFGTPEFATPPLLALLGEGHDVVGVVTQPDKPRGRSRSTLEPSPVKAIALAESIPVLQPERPRGPEFEGAMRELAPDISIVVAYGCILPRDVIDMPRLGTLNIHASLLPQYRGAAPIQAAIRDGLTETGVTIMQMVPELDAGPVILALRTPIESDETAGELQLRLAELGAEALIEALALLSMGKAAAAPQNDALATYAKKIVRDDARLSFDAPSDRVARIVRAYDPKPGAWATVNGGEVRCYGAQDVPDRAGNAGEVLEAGARGLVIACGEGAVRIAEVHPAGQKRIAAGDWVRGRGVGVGGRFA